MNKDEMKLFEEQFARDLANAKKEIELSEVSIKEHKAVQELMVLEHKAMVTFLKGFTIEGCKRINPEYVYENTTEHMEAYYYNKLAETKGKIHKLEDMHMLKNAKTILAKEEGLISLKEKVIKMESE